MIRYEVTQFGFNWGSLDVERACSDSKTGWVTLLLTTEKMSIQVHVTKSGKIKIYDAQTENQYELQKDK